MDLIAHMDVSGRTGKVSGTVEQLAQIARSTVPVFASALDDLRLTNTAKISNVNGFVTLVNRRMQREYKYRVKSNLRVKKFRGNASVTPKTSEVRDQNKEKSVNGNISQHKNNGAQLVIFQKEMDRISDRLNSISSQYDSHQSWDEKDKTESRKLKARREELKKLLGVTI